jgi:uncharacterized protein (DUF1330 family)
MRSDGSSDCTFFVLELLLLDSISFQRILRGDEPYARWGRQFVEEYLVTQFNNYPSLDPATFQPYGGRYIVHGGKTVTFEGDSPGNYVVIAFDSMEKVQAWRASAAFKEMYDIYKIGKIRVFAVQGVSQ